MPTPLTAPATHQPARATAPTRPPNRKAAAPRTVAAGTLRAGIVGLGAKGRDDHVPALAASRAVDLVAVCDADSAVVEAHQTEFGTTGYTAYNAMFAAENLDLVVICVPHHVGRAVITAAAEHGVHVLKEKPFAISLDEARDLAAVCNQSGIEVMVTLQRWFNPIYTAFPQLADQIGTPFVVDAQYTLAVDDPAAGWRGRADLAGGGCLVDMGSVRPASNPTTSTRSSATCSWTTATPTPSPKSGSTSSDTSAT